jgi:asparagine synthase (glutamine-hydrolysing)
MYLADPGMAEAGLHGKSLAAWESGIKPSVRNPFLSDPDQFKRNPEFRDHIYLGADDFSEALTSPWSEGFEEMKYSGDNLRNRMANELFHEIVPVILHEDDLNAMYYSIENRSPFLDRDLLDTISSVPTRHLVRDGYAKALLREAVRGIAPDAVIERRLKVGFNAPLFDLLDVDDPQVRDELMADSPIFQVVRRDVVEQWLSRSTLANSESKFLFNILNTKMFVEECGGAA